MFNYTLVVFIMYLIVMFKLKHLYQVIIKDVNIKYLIMNLMFIMLPILLKINLYLN